MIPRNLSRLCAATFLLNSLWTAPLTAADRFDPLLRRVPTGANAVMLVDVEAVNESPLARAQGWPQAHAAAYAQRPLVIPPETALLIVAAQLDAKHELQQNWELALLELTQPLPMTAIAKAEHGRQDKIENVNVVWSPSGAYFIDLGPKLLAILSPDDRQFVGRWALSQSSSGPGTLSNYLTHAVEAVSAPHPIVLALDLAYTVQPHRLREHLASSETLKGHPDRIDALIPVIQGLRGITLKVSLQDQADGLLRIDFSSDVSPMKDIARPLVLEALDLFDAHLPGLEKWKVHLDGSAIELSGALNDVAMRRIFSLLELPSTRFGTDTAGDAPSSQDQAVACSQTYYKSVSALIDDLKSTLHETRDNHAVWMERYAKKIDQLPLLHVDESLLDWGAMVAETMRTMALAERSAGIRSGVRKSSVYGNYFYYSGDGYSGSATSATLGQQYNQITREEKGQAKAVRFTSWKEMEDATAKVRREMTAKYQVEF